MKNKFNFVLINIIACVALIAVCSAFAKSYNPLFFASIAFLILAFIEETVICVKAFGETKEQYLLGLPAKYFSGLYVLVQSVFCLFFILVRNDNFRLGFIVELLWLAVFSIFILIAFMGKNTLIQKTEDRKSQKSNMIAISAKINGIEAMTEDRELKKAIRIIYENAKMSNPLFNNALFEVESEINNMVNELEKNIADKEKANELIKEIKILINKRENICKGL